VRKPTERGTAMNKDIKTGRLVDDLERGETRGGTVVAKGASRSTAWVRATELATSTSSPTARAQRPRSKRSARAGSSRSTAGCSTTSGRQGVGRPPSRLQADRRYRVSSRRRRGNGDGREQQADKATEQEADAEQEADIALNSEADKDLEPADAEPVAAAAAAAGVGPSARSRCTVDREPEGGRRNTRRPPKGLTTKEGEQCQPARATTIADQQPVIRRSPTGRSSHLQMPSR